jgi:hypothetical protein
LLVFCVFFWKQCSVANPHFPHPSADHIHGLSVIRLASMLHLIELVSCLTPGRFRKRAQIVECAASKLNGLEIGH